MFPENVILLEFPLRLRRKL